MSQPTISTRKADHLHIARHEDVLFHETSTLFEEVQLVHEALPDMSLDDVDTSVELFGRRLRIPLFIAAMTGGSEEAAKINRTLATVAQRVGCGFGLGSQRAMLVDESWKRSFSVREYAPDVLILGNLGIVQARQLSSKQVERLAREVDVDAMCVHMNPAMEIVQPEGDRDFSQGTETFARLVRELPIPVIAKETGCGISYRTARKLYDAGVRHVDVSGAGGTSWVAVESYRTGDQQRDLATALREWGVPTAASVSACAAVSMDTIIATGGIYTGMDVARAIALGASAAGMARSVLVALERDGERGVEQFLENVTEQLRATMLLVGARNLTQLRQAPRLLGERLRQWQSLHRMPEAQPT